MIKLNDIHFSYGNFKALDGISLDLGPGVNGVLGPNGAGKSTMMKLLLGFLKPDKGEGYILNKLITSNNVEARRYVGYMPETECIIPNMQAIDMITYLGELSGMHFKEASKRAHEVLYFVGMEDARYRKTDGFSTGMKQILKLAAAIIHDPKVLFLDEPTTGLDPSHRKKMLNLIQDIAYKSQSTILFSTHIMADIEEVSDRIIIMNKGKILKNIKNEKNIKNDKNIWKIKLKSTDIDKLLSEISGSQLIKTDRNSYIHSVSFREDIDSKEIFIAAKRAGLQIRQIYKEGHTLSDTFKEVIGCVNENN